MSALVAAPVYGDPGRDGEPPYEGCAFPLPVSRHGKAPSPCDGSRPTFNCTVPSVKPYLSCGASIQQPAPEPEPDVLPGLATRPEAPHQMTMDIIRTPARTCDTKRPVVGIWGHRGGHGRPRRSSIN
jgi:hypothetical protein